MPGQGDNSTPAAARLRLPAFIPAEPKLWFAIIERTFELANVTTEQGKYNATVAGLDPKYAMEVKDLILQIPATTPYTTLKDGLLKRIGATQEQKTRELLDHQEIGDRKPTQFLRALKDLGGDGLGANILKSMWMSRLPTPVQAILASQKSDTAIEALAELADAIMETDIARPQVAAMQTASQFGDLAQQFTQMTLELRREIASLRNEVSARDTGRSHQRNAGGSRGRSRSRSRPRNTDLCWYHDRFGARAKKCDPPCTFSGNDLAAR